MEARFSIDQFKGKELSPTYRPDALVLFRAEVELHFKLHFSLKTTKHLVEMLAKVSLRVGLQRTPYFHHYVAS